METEVIRIGQSEKLNYNAVTIKVSANLIKSSGASMALLFKTVQP